MKKTLIAVAMLLALYAGASTIKVWTNGDALTAADLNAVFAHIHGTMVGGHGARLVNADVSASAAISQSKIVRGANIPRAWAASSTVCTSNGACALSASNNITSVSRTAGGQYSVVLAYTTTDAGYMAMTGSGGPLTAGIATAPCWCNTNGNNLTTTGFGIRCWDAIYDGGGPATKDCNFNIVVIDPN